MKKTLIFFLFGIFAINSFGQDKVVLDLKVQGNKKIKTDFIKKLATIRAGVVLDSAAIEKDIRRLKRLPSVAHAYYQVFHSHDNLYNVFYNVEENFTIIPSANIYTSNDGEFAYRLGLYEFNLLGRSMTFGGFYQKDIYSSYGINFRAPYLFNRQFGVAINHQDLTTQEPVFFNDATADYKYRNNSYEVLGLYEIDFQNRLEAGINYFSEDYEYKSGATSEDVPQTLNVKKLLYKFIYEYNDLDYDYQYVSGFKSALNFQYVTSTSDALPEFLIGRNDFFYYARVGSKGNWANRMRIGFSTNNDTPFAPFAVDNNINIRGVGNVIDRGTGAMVLNTEYRHTLYEKGWFCLQGNAFVDAGTWRNPGGDLGDFGKSQNIRVYPGVGLRFLHKQIFNAIFRIDYGIGITKDSAKGLVFGIGQYF